MENIQHTEAYKRKRRFLMAFPLLIVPFITVIFWLLGGGNTTATVASTKTGLNLQLPNARGPKDSAKDKLAFYQMADADSVKRLEQSRMDPYHKDTMSANSKQVISPTSFHYGAASKNEVDAGQEKLNERIAAIQRQLSVPQKVTASKDKMVSESYEPGQLTTQPAAAKQTDPEIEALNGTLEKILEIQHPERLKEKNIQKNSVVFEVSNAAPEEETYFGKKDTSKKQNTFYKDAIRGKSSFNAIEAVIPVNQVLQNGSIVKLQLITAIAIKGNTLPAGSFVFGIASLENERLQIHIPSVRYENNLLAVSLLVYDMDGLEGIYVPGSITRDVTKESADQGLQSIGIAGFDASLKTQAAAIGIGAAKSLLSKKVKQVRITVTAGYKLLLRDNKPQSE